MREVAQSCSTLCDLMDCSLPGSSIHGVFQARVLEWGAKSCYQHPNADLGGKHTFSTLLSKYQAIAGSQGQRVDSFCSFSPHMVPLLPSQPWRAVLHICTTLLQDFSGGSVVKNLSANAGHARDTSLIPESGRFDPLEYKMATHSSTLAWKIPWTEEPGGL